MDANRFFQALLDAKPCCTVTDKISRSGRGGKPGLMTVRFSDGANVSFIRTEAARLKSDEQLAAFVAKVLQ